MHWKDVVAKMLVPNEKLGSVVDTFVALGEILEARQKVVKGEYFAVEDFDKAVVSSLFTLGFFPFFMNHGLVLRPLLLQAIQSKSPTFLEDFFCEAIPCALTIAMPHRQLEYASIRDATREMFAKT